MAWRCLFEVMSLMASSEFKTLLGGTKEIKVQIAGHERSQRPEWGRLQAWKCLAELDCMYGERSASSGGDSVIDTGSSFGVWNVGAGIRLGVGEGASWGVVEQAKSAITVLLKW